MSPIGSVSSMVGCPGEAPGGRRDARPAPAMRHCGRWRRRGGRTCRSRRSAAAAHARIAARVGALGGVDHAVAGWRRSGRTASRGARLELVAVDRCRRRSVDRRRAIMPAQPRAAAVAARSPSAVGASCRSRIARRQRAASRSRLTLAVMIGVHLREPRDRPAPIASARVSAVALSCAAAGGAPRPARAQWRRAAR